MFKKYTELEGWSNGLWGPDYFVHAVEENDSGMDIHLKSVPHAAICPECGEETTKLACGYGKTLVDMPLKGLLPTRIHVQTYKYVCENDSCPVKVFADPLPFARLNEYRTERLNELILGMSIFMSNEGTSRVLRQMGIQVSADAISRLWKKVKLEELEDVETVGIDDIALRKGQTYATSLYAGNHQLIAILPGRTADDVKGWLKEHPKIERVARDRASAYASAISEVLPEAVQTADRFHLLQNILKHLSDILQVELPPEIWLGEDGLMDKSDVRWERKTESKQPPVDVSKLHYDNAPPVDDSGVEVEYDAQNHLTGSAAAREREEKRRQKQARVRAVRKMHAEGVTKAEISRTLQVSSGTVSRYLKMTEKEVEELILPRKREVQSRAGRYRNIVFKMMRDGHDDRTIFWYLRKIGIDDPVDSICTVIRTISMNNFPGRARMHTSRITGAAARSVPVNAKRVSRKQLGVFLCTLDSRRKPDPVLDKHLPEVMKKYPAAAWAQEAFRSFHAAVTGDDPEAVTQFIAAYRNSPLKSFCKGLEMDMEAVCSAVRDDLSSGFVEGGNNKIKVIKRIGYGRASLPSLEAKCVLAFQCTKIPEYVPSSALNYPKRRVRLPAA